MNFSKIYSRLPEEVINITLSFYNPYKTHFDKVLCEIKKITDHLNYIYEYRCTISNYYPMYSNNAAIVNGSLIGNYFIPNSIYYSIPVKQYWKQKFLQEGRNSIMMARNEYWLAQPVSERYKKIQKGENLFY